MSRNRILTRMLTLLAIAFLLISSPTIAFWERNHEDISRTAFGQPSVLEILGQLAIEPEMPLASSGGARTPVDWVRQGARDEDAYVSANLIRFRNHFYDPYSGHGLTLGPVPLGHPAPAWALEDTEEFLTQTYSYRDARAAFLQGLTIAEPGPREAKLAQTFKILGHVFHMIQDMAAPAHVRNDTHIGVEPIWPDSLYERLLGNGTISLTLAGTPVAPRPPRQFWTTGDSLWGSGLADFTNRGFISEGTNFTSKADGATGRGGYPQPTLRLGNGFENQESIQTLLPDFRDLQGNRIEGTLTFFANDMTHPITHAPLRNPRMTTHSIFDRELIKNNRPPVFMLNRFNIEEQAKILVPLAVGYSTGLLDTFFLAGSFDFLIEFDDQNPSRLRFLFQNRSEHTMVGTFTLYADKPDGTRVSIVSTPPETSMSIGWNAPIPFEIGALPDGVKALIVVFQGTHGPDPNAVGGRVKPWEMPVILAKQDVAEFAGDVIDTEDQTQYPTYFWKNRRKDPGKQRVTGTFITPSDTPSGKHVKRIWLDSGPYTSPGATLRLRDKDGVVIPWDPVSTNPATLADQTPATYEIEVDWPTIWASSDYYDPDAQQWRTRQWVTLPRYLVIETLAGILIKNPLVWWQSITGTSAARSSGDLRYCAVGDAYNCLWSTLTSTTVMGTLFFGDGNAAGEDRTPTGAPYPVSDPPLTSVHFTPAGPVAGHGVGVVINNSSETCFPIDICAAREGSCSGNFGYIFQSPGVAQWVWTKENVSYEESYGVFKTGPQGTCLLPTPTLPELPTLPEVRLQRMYFPGETALFMKLGVQQGPDHTVTLK
jgi:hypothetical protein